MLPGRRALLAMLLLLPASGRTEAGTIAISTNVAATTTASGLAVTLKITNSGDEAARSVVPSVILAGGVPIRGQPVATLPPGQRLDALIEIPWKEKGRGQWPLATSVEYTDANGYPLQAVQVALITLGAPAPSVIAVIGTEGATLETSGDIHVRLKSLSAVPQQVQLRAVAPRGLVAVAPRPTLSIEPWADQKSVIQLTNRSVLPGSRIPVFVVAEYDDLEGHHTSIAHHMVEIRAATPTSARPAPSYAFIAAGILVGLWVGLIAWQRRSRTPTLGGGPPASVE